MKRRIFIIFLMSVIGLFFFPIHEKAEAENWKRFFKDEKGIWYYDKDSLHYPYNTKGFLGAIKTDKSIVRVWIKVGKWIVLEQIWCSQREVESIDGHNSELDVIDSRELDAFERRFRPEFYNFNRERIIPGSWEEKLYNEVCK